MATKNFQFFIRIDELVRLLKELLSKFGFLLIFYKGGSNPELILLEDMEALRTDVVNQFDRLYIATSKPEISKIDVSELMPAKLGWLQLDLPKEECRALYLSELSLKSDWYDRDAQEVVENKELDKFYRKIRGEMKRNLTSPVWARNIKTHGSSCYRDMAYSKTVVDWEDKGGELRQLGVDNVRFSVKK